jgi:hypothetical protein
LHYSLADRRLSRVYLELWFAGTLKPNFFRTKIYRNFAKSSHFIGERLLIQSSSIKTGLKRGGKKDC